ncbi:MAG: outer membrane protein assembly factor BamA [Rickettsiales bacterium]|jgi:outer membrane protein insertion porin family|nr:outer membrane protein assembly factor BamA [Rickettsiales bacterium]
MKNRHLPFFLLLSVPVFFGAGYCAEKPKSSNIIKEITISGNKHYNAIYYLETAEVNVGDRFSRELKNSLEKKLITTGRLDQVGTRYSSESGILEINLDEKPLISKITFNGAKELDKDEVMENIKLKTGEIFSERFLLEDKNFINIFYRSQGYYNIKVDYELKRLDGNFVEITVNISKGKEAKIRKIYFVGNGAFKDNDLKSEIFSRENKFYRFGKSIDYDPNILDYDKHMLEKFYRSKGYFNVKVISAVGIYNAGKNNFDIVYSVEENKKYLFGKISIDDQVGKVNIKILEEKIKSMKSGDVFDANLIAHVTKELDSVFVDMGYLTISANPDFKETGSEEIDLIFRITYDEAKRTRYVGKIEIYGNSKTRDQVLRRALDIEEGSQYNEFLLERSLQKVKNLGFFSEVVHEEVEGTLENQSDIILGVVEDRTGSVTFSVSYSTIDKFNGSIGFEQRNLFGRAINLATDLTVSEFSKSVSLGFSKPNVFGTKARGGFGFVFNDEKNSKNPSFKIGFDEYIAGFNGFLRFDITDYLSQKLAYRFDYKKISYLEQENEDIFPNEGRLTSEVSTNLSYDKRDLYFSPTRGYHIDLDLAVAGLGGDRKYLKTVGHFAYYYPLYLDKVIFRFEVKLGHIRSLSKNSLLYPIDGFYLGGLNMRGFKYGGAGPRITHSNGESEKSIGLGGMYLCYLNTEVKFPIYLHKMFGIYGIFFANAGTTTGMERKNKKENFTVYDSGRFRSSAGFSLLFRLGVVDLTLDFSKTIRKETYDRDEKFRIDIGTGARF